MKYKFLHVDLDKQDAIEWLALFIVAILNVVFWWWYFCQTYGL